MKNENPFKDKLYHHTLPVNDDLWSRIEPQLPTGGSKKKLPFLWLTLAAFTLSAGVLFMIQLQKKAEAPLRQEQNIYPGTDSTTTANDVSFIQHENVSKEVLHDEVQFASLVNNGADGATPSNLASNDVIANDQKVKTKRGDTHREGVRSQSEKFLIVTPHTPLPIDDESQLNTKYPSTLLDNKSNTSESDPLQFRSGSMMANSHVSFLPGLAYNELEVTVTDDFAFGIFTIKPDPSCYKFTGMERRSNVSLDLFFAPGFGPRSFKSSTAETAIYAEARDKTENNRYAMSFGARLNLNLSNEVAVRAGIMYEVIGDVFNYVDSAAMRSSTHIDSFFSSNGTFLYADTVRIFEPGTQVKRIHNRYHHLDIPLLVSYELPLGRARLMVNAGPVFNLASGARGQILDPMLVPRHITQTASSPIDVYKTSLGLSVYIGAGALIPISKQFSGLIEPRFLYRIKPVTLESYPLAEQRHSAGVNLGLRYHFE